MLCNCFVSSKVRSLCTCFIGLSSATVATRRKNLAEKSWWPRIRQKKMRLAANPPNKCVSRPNIRKKIQLRGLLSRYLHIRNWFNWQQICVIGMLTASWSRFQSSLNFSIFLTTFKFPDFSRFSRWVTTLYFRLELSHCQQLRMWPELWCQQWVDSALEADALYPVKTR